MTAFFCQGLRLLKDWFLCWILNGNENVNSLNPAARKANKLWSRERKKCSIMWNLFWHVYTNWRCETVFNSRTLEIEQPVAITDTLLTLSIWPIFNSQLHCIKNYKEAARGLNNDSFYSQHFVSIFFFFFYRAGYFLRRTFCCLRLLN